MRLLKPIGPPVSGSALRAKDAAHTAGAAVDGDVHTYWSPVDRGSPSPSWIECDLGGDRTFDCAMLQENIALGQHVEEFKLESLSGGEWKEIAKGTTIGYKRLLRFPEVTAARVRLTIAKTRSIPALSHFGLYRMAK